MCGQASPAAKDLFTDGGVGLFHDGLCCSALAFTCSFSYCPYHLTLCSCSSRRERINWGKFHKISQRSSWCSDGTPVRGTWALYRHQSRHFCTWHCRHKALWWVKGEPGGNRSAALVFLLPLQQQHLLFDPVPPSLLPLFLPVVHSWGKLKQVGPVYNHGWSLSASKSCTCSLFRTGV